MRWLTGTGHRATLPRRGGSAPRGWPSGGWVLLLGWLAVMAAVAPVDRDWTFALSEALPRGWADWMERSLFEGEGFGGGDPMTLVQIAGFFAYLVSWWPRSPLSPWRARLGLLVLMALAVDLAAVHAVKSIAGRARPMQVFTGAQPFTPWYAFGDWLHVPGRASGSFPSGHTATAAFALCFAYWLAGDPRAGATQRSWGWVLGVVALGYALAMALARVVTRDHWLSDGLASLGGSWLVLHVLYYGVLRVPERDRPGARVRVPALWELRLSAWAIALMLGCAGAARGAREWLVTGAGLDWLTAGSFLAALSLFGGLRLWWAVWRCMAIPFSGRG